MDGFFLKRGLSAGLLLASLTVFADSFRVTTETERWKDASSTVVSSDAGGTSVVLDAGRFDQTMVGFGTALSELGWDALGVIGEEQRKAVLDELYSDTGGGFTVVRLPIGSSDFARSYYSYDDCPGDFAMERFSIDRDKSALLPFVREVQKRVPAETLRIWASPWCPPRWMKRTGRYASVPLADWYGPETTVRNDCTAETRMYEGEDGFICEPRHLDAYALYFRKYVDAYRAEGVPIWMVMPQNEPNSCQPYPSCGWRIRSLVDFVGRLGRALEGSGTEVYMGTIERNSQDWITSALEDPVAGKYVKGAGFQWCGKLAAAATHVRLPKLPIVQTEQECGNGSNSWSYAWHTWDLMKQYIGHGAGLYMYWNVALMRNEPSTWGWYQNSLVSVDRATGRWSFTHDYAFFKHLSHFVRRGAKRLVPQEGGYGDVLAFANPDGSTVVVLANPGKEKRTCPFASNRRSAR